MDWTEGLDDLLAGPLAKLTPLERDIFRARLGLHWPDVLRPLRHLYGDRPDFDDCCRRLLAIVLGFSSTALLVITREGMLSGEVSWWLIGAFSMPVLYSAYNWFAALWWPRESHSYAAGVAESLWSGLLALPFLYYFAPPWGSDQLPLPAYATVGIATLMWVAERIAFFTLIREKGAVFTVPAVYLSTPAAVVIAVIFFGGADIWLFVSLLILMAALYLNNSGSAAKAKSS